jgi:uncharacterized protein
MKHPIPDAALDDRLGFIGTSGSGKTYNAGGAVERLLRKRARVVIVDPLGVWWGLRLDATGKQQSPYSVVIFGGPRGDLPLTEHAGALIGETAATMAESCIVDLSELGTKAADRRFMTAFLDTIFRKASGEPFHLVVDEADLFAPQKPAGGDETLLGLMEQIVRRGRVKGFIPWLISQRPAVLNKNVLSQVDGLVAFKLTASQDRDALDAWIEGQADKAQGKAIKDQLPAMQIGQGVVWLPGRGVLDTVAFPAKETFDSSRTPKRGEKKRRTAALKPLDLGALKDRLATVEQEAKANDPKKLRAEIAALKKAKAELERKRSATPAPDPDALKSAEQRGFERGEKKGMAATAIKEIRKLTDALFKLESTVAMFSEKHRAELAGVTDRIKTIVKQLGEVVDVAIPPASLPAPLTYKSTPAPVAPLPPRATQPESTEVLTPAKQRILDAIAWVCSLGQPAAPKETVAFLADASPNSSAYANNLGALRSAGLIDYPAGGMLALTEPGLAAANPPPAALDHQSIMAKVAEKLPPAQMRILNVVAGVYPQWMEKEAVANAAGASPASSAYANNLGRLRTLGLITYPQGGMVVAADRLFP